MLSVTPKPDESAPKTGPAENAGAIFRILCRLDLVSCFLLSRDRAEELITDGTNDPISLYAEDGVESKLTSNGHVKAPQAFLQLTPQVVYPLGPDVPCLQAKSGYFVFPLPENRYYGIVFPEGYPEDVVATFRSELAKYSILCVENEQGEFVKVQPGDIAAGCVQVVQLQDEERPKSVLQNVAVRITTGASYVTWSIRSTSNFLRTSIEKTGTAISQKVQKPNANAHVPKVIQSSVGFIKDITPGFVYISGGAASALAALAGYFGSGIGAMLPNGSGGGQNGVVLVGAASISAIAGILNELTGVGKNLIEGTQQASVQVVTSRYGDEAGQLTNNLLGITKDVYQVARNMKSIGIRSLGKASLKSAGKELVQQVLSPPTTSSSASPSGLPASLANELKGVSAAASSTLKQINGSTPSK